MVGIMPSLVDPFFDDALSFMESAVDSIKSKLPVFGFALLIASAVLPSTRAAELLSTKVPFRPDGVVAAKEASMLAPASASLRVRTPLRLSC